jgi:hypothetical protein
MTISKTLTALLGGVVVSLMCASNASANCADPSPLARQTLLTTARAAALAPSLAAGGQLGPGDDNGDRHAGSLRDRIVGTWLVTYAGTVTGQAFIQWHSDGTEWENINHPVLAGNICMGDWRVVDENHVSRSHAGWRFSNGSLVGYFIWTETDEVAPDGSWYRGTNYIRLYDINGAQVFEGAGTSEATRIPQP